MPLQAGDELLQALTQRAQRAPAIAAAQRARDTQAGACDDDSHIPRGAADEGVCADVPTGPEGPAHVVLAEPAAADPATGELLAPPVGTGSGGESSTALWPQGTPSSAAPQPTVRAWQAPAWLNIEVGYGYRKVSLAAIAPPAVLELPLFLGEGVSDGATAAEATQSRGVVRLRAEAGTDLLLTFSGSAGRVSKALLATGAEQPVVLSVADLATLGEGPVGVELIGRDGAARTVATGHTHFVLDTIVPDVPMLALGTGVAGGATATEATQAAGVVAVTAESGASLTVTFVGLAGYVSKMLTATGLAQAVVLDGADLLTLGDGAVSVSAVARDAAGNVSGPGSNSFVLDTVVSPASISPTIGTDTGLVASITSGGLTRDDTLALEGTAEAGSVVEIYDGSVWLGMANLVGTAWTFTTPALAQGERSLTARITDGAGNSVTTSAVTVTVDITAPDAPILALGAGVADGATAAEATQATGVVTVAGESAATLTVNFKGQMGSVSKTFTSTGSAQAVVLESADLATLGEGPVSVSAVARDAAGHVGRQGVSTFVLDTTAPSEPVLVPGEGVFDGATAAEATQDTGVVTVTGESGTTLTVTFVSDSGRVVKTLTATGSAQAVVLQSADLATLGEGAVSVSAQARDAAGNVGGQGTSSFVLDTAVSPASISPTIGTDTGLVSSITSGGLTRDNTLALQGTAEAGSLVQIYDGTVWLGTAILVGTAWTFTTPALGQGLRSLTARVTDGAGNSVTTSAVTANVDITAPDAPILALGAGVEGGATAVEAVQASGLVTVSGESGATLTVTFKGQIGSVSKTLTGTGAPQAVVLHSDDLAKLGEGTLRVSAEARDPAGNVSTESAVSFEFDTVVSLASISPTIGTDTGLVSSITSGGLTRDNTMELQGTAEAGSVVQIFNGSVLQGTAALTGTVWRFTTPQLGQGLHSFTARITDRAGNTVTTSAVTATMDNIAPATPDSMRGIGVENGATADEATQASGVLLFLGEAGSSLVFLIRNNDTGIYINKSMSATGAFQPLVLDSADVAKLGDGRIGVVVRVTDAAGNIGLDGDTFFILDTAAPLPPVLRLGAGLADGATLAELTQLTGAVTVTGEAGASLSVTFSGQKGSVTKTLTGTGSAQAVVLTADDVIWMGDGSASASVVITDTAGNRTTGAPLGFTVSTGAPVMSASVVGPPEIVFPLALRPDLPAIVQMTLDEATSFDGVLQISIPREQCEVTVTLTGSAGQVTTGFTGGGTSDIFLIRLWSFQVRSLGDGMVNIEVTARNAAGNRTTERLQFYLDTVAPVAPVLTLGEGVADGATAAEATQADGVLTVTTETSATVNVTFIGTRGRVLQTLLPWFFTPSSRAVTLSDFQMRSLGEGEVTVSVMVRDGAGNESPTSTTRFVLNTLTSPTPATRLASVGSTIGADTGAVGSGSSDAATSDTTLALQETAPDGSDKSGAPNAPVLTWSAGVADGAVTAPPPAAMATEAHAQAPACEDHAPQKAQSAWTLIDSAIDALPSLGPNAAVVLQTRHVACCNDAQSMHIQTLRLTDGASIDLMAVADAVVSGRQSGSRVDSIDRIDLATDGAANTLKLALSDVLDMAGTNLFNTDSGWRKLTGTALGAVEQRHQLVIDGTEVDTVSVLGGSAWSLAGTVQSGISGAEQTYNVWNHASSAAQLLVDADIRYVVL